jgi:hypothetical protein
VVCAALEASFARAFPVFAEHRVDVIAAVSGFDEGKVCAA